MMKEIKFIFFITAVVLVFHSCYTSELIVGNARGKHLAKVGTRKNFHLLNGFIPLNKRQIVSDFIGNDNQDYVIETKRTFLDCFCNLFLLPIGLKISTTNYYIPIGYQGYQGYQPNTN